MDYCKQHGIKIATLRKWCNKLKPKMVEIKKEKFLSFKLSPANVRVCLPNGINIDVIGHDAIELVKALINVV